MSSWVYRQYPLPWTLVEKLLANMTETIEELEDQQQRIHLARYQTAIAFGCYVGPTAKEILTLTWRSLLKDLYTFRFESRSSMVVDAALKRITHKNYLIVSRGCSDHYVLANPFRMNQPISPTLFNGALRTLFKQFGIQTPEPNFQTLRKTFARKTYEDLSCSTEALQILSDELGYKSTLMKAYLRMENEQQIPLY